MADSTHFEELIVEALDALEQEGQAGVERVCRAHPEDAERLRERVRLLGSFGLVEAESHQVRERLGGFRLIKPLGMGGMGIVYLAEDERLNRQVALKIIRPEQLFFPGARERFQREVEIIARLHHPGIVPIYTVGEEHSVPYFAMELLRGVTLDERMRLLAPRGIHDLVGRDLAADPADAGYLFAGTWEEACLRVVRQVADALEHAHKEGVVHRDIKPSNVMLTSDGTSRVVLLDFGLAASTSSGSLTRSGTQVGSVRYMSPEQIRGESTRVGPTSDVYSLGVTLHELLALDPAFKGRTDVELMGQIDRGNALPLRQKNPRVSWETETVCLTAMEVDPARRYQSAADFARDLDNVLAKRPIEARRMSAWRRTRRFVERNPALTAALALAVLLFVGGPLFFAWQQRSARIEISAQRDRAESFAVEVSAQRDRAEGLAVEISAQRDRAEASLEQSLGAVDAMLARVADVDLQAVPQMEPVRRALLQDALVLLERIAESEQGDVRTLLAQARTQRRMGRLHQELGNSQESAETFALALATFARANDPSTALEELQTRVDRMVSLINAGRNEEAASEHEVVLAAIAELRARIGDSVGLEQAVVQALDARAGLYVSAGDTANARTTYEQVTQLADAMLARDPKSIGFLRTSSHAWNEYGLLLMQAFSEENERNPLAEAALSRALELFERVTALDPTNPQIAYQRALAENNYAGALRRAKDHPGALRHYDEALAIFERLVRDFPNTALYAQELATVNNQIALLYDYEQNNEKADFYYGRTVEILRALALRTPREPLVFDRLAQAIANHSATRKARKEYGEAVRMLEEAIGFQKRAIEIAPEVPEYRRSLSVILGWLAQMRRATGDIEGAVAAADEMVQAFPDHWRPYTVAANEYARALTAVRKLETLSADERARREADYIARAVAAMRGAIERKAPAPKDLHELKDLAPLHGSPEFEALAKERLEAQE